jgi:hypothetical protein
VARRVVEDDAADRTLFLGDHLGGDGLVEHVSGSLLFVCAVIASVAKQSRAVQHSADEIASSLRSSQ